ncbi:MAG: WhiB family transcriptional regulator [Streptomyces sp.]|nr:WhiB family transcriptional regulator [Streptomyces sp.]NUS15449.1 WhiB family transcriptional regulator [Streptomyces sp.]NUS24093.1 WhiB family transcriptional regulator [Streptomyces sp.]
MTVIPAEMSRDRTSAAPAAESAGYTPGPVAPDWQNQAGCRTADPDLFWPEPSTPTERIQEAKTYCASCPVAQACLDNAFRINDWDSIAGGRTGAEREQLLSSGNVTNRFHARRLDNSDARKLAVQYGAEILRCLVKRRMSVAEVGERMSASPRAMYGAFRMLVPPPPGPERVLKPSSVERLLMYSQVSLLTLAGMGRSHESMARSLGTAQTVVSAALSVYEQRERGLRLVHRGDREQALELCWAQETRIRREAGVGLTVDDVIDMAGIQILALAQEGLTLRAVALKLGINREAVRKAHVRLTKKKTLTKTDMEEAA